MTPSNRVAKWFRTLLKSGLAMAVAMIGLVAVATPAFAHGNDVSGVTSCASPLGTGYVVTWTLANDWDEMESGTITSVTGGLATLNTTTFSINAQTNPSKDQSATTPFLTATVKQTLPATASGTITMDISGTWTDGTVATDSGTASLSGINCAAPIQTIGGHIYLCNNSNPTTTEETGGTLSASGPSTVASTPNPMNPTDVSAGSYTMTAAPPPGYILVSCGGSSTVASGGGSATESVTVPSAGAGVGIFYVTADAPAITLTKSVTQQSYSAVGQTINYNYLVKNTGNVTLTAITVNDPHTGLIGLTCPNSSLTAGASETCTATYLVTAADMTAGSILNTATASGTPPTGSPVTSPPSSAVVDVAELTIVKSSTTKDIQTVGQVVPYSFLVTNTGKVSLTSVSVTDTQVAPSLNGGLSAISCPSTTLAAGANETCTANYTATAADIANGSVKDSATATGTPPGGSPITSPPSNLSIPVASITIAKSASPTVVSASGQTVTYSFLVTNTGTSTLSSVFVTDTQVSPSLGSSLSAITCPSTTLAAGASTTCTATYTVTAADVTNGTINDSATATGTPPSSTPITSTPSTAVVTVAGLTVVKSSTTKDVQTVGQVVPYSFLVTNTGKAGLTAVSVTDTQVSPSLGSSLSAISCPSTTLAAGANETCTANYTVTSADLANGSVQDSAIATGTPPSGPPITTPPSTLNIPAATITIVKSASPTVVSASGQTVTYSFLVTNTGKTALSSVFVTDSQVTPSLGTSLSAITCPSTTLAAGASTTCTATYTVSAADITNRTINDSAVATGTPPSGTPITSTPSTAVVDVAGLTIVKSSTTKDIQTVGQVVPYSFLVTNTGVTALTSVSVADTQVSPSLDGGLSAIACPSTTLAAGAAETCTANYTVTAADIANGSVQDSATTTGTPPSGPPITTPPSTLNIPASAITIAKSASPTVVSSAGSTVTYSFLVTNTGKTSLSSVFVTDSQVAPSLGTSLSAITCPATTLAAGASTTCVATYTVTAADIANGTINDSATATGTPPSGTPITSTPSTAVVDVAGLTIVKSSTTKDIQTVGQVVPYSFLVTNTGVTALTSVSVADTQVSPSLNGGLSAIACPSTTLAAGAAETCTANYTVTAADITHGSVQDSATATGTPPSGPPVTTPPSTLNIPASTITILKSASPTVVSASGQTVTYSFLVTNTGKTSLSSVFVTDTQAAPSLGTSLSAITCPATTLAAGASTTCVATYTVSAADISNGTINDSATATGTPPSSTPITSTPSTAVVTVAGLTVVKSSTTKDIQTAGQVVPYAFLVTNTGKANLTSVTVSDTQVAPSLDGGLSAITCPSTTLAAGANETCTANYTVTAADIANGSVQDSATATGTPPSGPPITTPPSTVNIPAATITIAKSASPTVVSASGSTVTYSFLVTNTGKTSLSSVFVTDSQVAPSLGTSLSAITCPSTTLAAGASTTCTATYTVSAADISNGTINDSATATGTPPSGTPITSTPSTAVVDVAGLTIAKSSSTKDIQTVGQVVPYSFLVTNTGVTTLSSVSVTDSQVAPSLNGGLSAITCPSPTLAAGVSETCAADYTVTAADLANGSVQDSATATGTPPSGPPITTPPSTLNIPASTITIAKSANPTVVSKSGSTVTYSFLVTNTGKTPLSSVFVTDTQVAPSLGTSLSAITCPSTTLAAGASTTCTATYTVSAADITNGTINDSATATGTPPSGTPITSVPSTAVVDVAGLSVVKSSTTKDIQSVGQVVPYSFLVTNSGVTTLTDVSVTDTLVAPSLAGSLSAITCPSTTLAAGASETCTANYTATAADLANGSVQDSATATGTPPSGPPITTPPSTVNIPASTITIAKSASPTVVSASGQTVTYSFLVTNTGKTSLTSVFVTDTQVAPSLGTALSAITCPTTTLAAGASTTCVATYTVSAADITNGTIDDSATATGTPPSGTPITSVPSTAVVNVAGLSVVKSSTTKDIQSVGQVVPYSFLVTNTGVTTLSSVSVTDSQVAPSLDGGLSAITCPSTTLTVGANETCTANYTVTAADLANGSVQDSATATGTPPSGPPITTPPSTVNIPASTITIAKSASPTVVSASGQTVTYSFLVTNTGKTSLSSVFVTDTQIAPSLATALSAITCPSTTLAAGASTTCTATYTVSAADIANGTINDTATSTGTPPSGTPITSVPSTAVVNVAGLSVVKSSTTKDIQSVGQVVPYVFLVTNTGVTTLTNVTVTDSQVAPSLDGGLSAITCPSTTLAAGASETCTANYTVTAADLTNGSVQDSAIATGTPPSGPPITTPPSTVNIPASTISIAKSASPTVVSASGQTVTYSFLVTNTGKTSLNSVFVTDTQVAPSLGSALSAIACPSTTLAAGASTTCTATYTVSAADITNGTINDSAIATGTPPSGTPINSVPSTATVDVAGISVVKSSTTKDVQTVGQVVPYSFLVTNTGVTTLTNVSVTDTQVLPSLSSSLSAITCPTSTLAAGSNETCTANYTVTAADLANGSVQDSATATGTPPSGPPITTPPSTLNIPASTITIAKSASPTVVSASGQTVTYSFVVTNTGKTSLSSVFVTDTQVAPSLGTSLSAITCPSTTLAAGASTTCTATYSVSTADITNGTINDSAIATGTPPSGTPINSVPSTATVDVAGISVVKSSSTKDVQTVGQVVPYSFLVTNTGVTTLTGITVTDTQVAPSLGSSLSAITCPSTSLEASASETCTANYTVTAADLSNGSVQDSATATGTPPSGPPITTPPSTLNIPASTITIAKSANPVVVSAAGQIVTYSFLVTNTGQTSLSSVFVTDTQIAPSLASALSAITCPVTTLAAGASTTCTATYTVSAADITNGTINDTATATGTPPSGMPITSVPSTATVDVAGISVVKSSTSPDIQSVGQVVPYSFLVTNTGVTTLTGITVTDTQVAPSLGSSLSAITCPSTSLNAGDSETCTANYTVTAADLANGATQDSATATGTPPSGPPITTPPSTLNIPASTITIAKSASPTVVSAAGSTVTYSFVVTNTGQTSLSSVFVTDTQAAPSLGTSLSTITCPATTLAAGASTTCTATYTVTAADIANLTINDSAIATGTPPSGTPINSSPSTATVDVAGISVVKSSTTKDIQTVGQVVPYSFLVTNTGITTLTSISVTDTQIAPSLDSSLSAITCPSASLAAGANETCTANYTVTAADLANGATQDSATATGTPPSGPPITTPPSTVNVPASTITIAKSASPTVVSAAGQTVTYSFVVTNTGQTTLTGVFVTDTQVAPSLGTSLSAITCPVTTLAAGASTTCTATYTVTAADIANGTINDTAIATGTPPSTTPINSGPSTATVDVAGLTVVKSSTTTEIVTVGQVVPYAFLVTNTGVTTLSDITVTDSQLAPSLDSSLSVITCPSTTLKAGDSETCTANYTVTAADIANGSTQDSATATGTPPSGPPITTPPSTVTIPTPPAPPVKTGSNSSPPVTSTTPAVTAVPVAAASPIMPAVSVTG